MSELRRLREEIDRDLHLASAEAHMRWQPLELRVDRVLAASEAPAVDALRELLEETREAWQLVRRPHSTAPPPR